RAESDDRVATDSRPGKNADLRADPDVFLQDDGSDTHRGVGAVPVDPQTVEVGVHDHGSPENRARPDPDLLLASKNRPVDDGVAADVGPGVGGVGPRCHGHTPPDVVAEDDATGAPQDQLAVDAKVPTGLEADASQTAGDTAPESPGEGERFADRDAGLRERR